MSRCIRIALALLALLALLPVDVPQAAATTGQGSPLVFTVTLAPGVAAKAHLASERRAAETLDGRIYVIVSRQAGTEPRLQGTGLDANGAPIWGLDVDGFHSGAIAGFSEGDPRVYGFPFPSLRELPAGTYFAQALMNVYETFHRSDGSTVKLHMPCGDGHRIVWSTGNLYSDVQKVVIEHSGRPVSLQLSHVIEPYEPTPPGGTCQQGNPPESEHVKFLKMKSERLSRFWGRPMYIAAQVLLPRGYKEHPHARYPVIFGMDHHPRAYRIKGNDSRGFYQFREDGSNSFSKWWLGPQGPAVVVVQPLSETPYYDTSYWVNSVNVGPYGDALLEELLPAINSNLRTIDQRWARTLTGCSSGGWMSAAPQILYPDTFGGAFIFAPDIVDFRSLWLLDLYTEPNAYFNETEWRRWPRPFSRDPSTGNTTATTGDWAHLELAMGNKSRSGEYFAQIDATWGPRERDGFPVPKWDPQSGTIDHAAVRAHSRFDLSSYLEANWARLEPKLRHGRLQFFVTETDNYYTNLAVHRLESRVRKLTPASDAQFNYFPSGPHCGTPITQEQLVARMVDFMKKQSQAESVR